MITFFTTPKPFRGHIGIIQRNATENWNRMHTSVEVILFGDEECAAGPWPAAWPTTVDLIRARGDCRRWGTHLLPRNGTCDGGRSLRAK
jgi:hypothetical protein